MIIACNLCKKKFQRRPSEFRKRKQHFCSIKCRNSGFVWSDKMRKDMGKKIKKIVTGRIISAKGRKNMSLAKMGSKHPLWKGNKVGYKSLHEWISRNWGKPSLCEVCKTKKSKKYEWANLGIYDRERKNWKRMCCSCHAKFDNKIKNINNK